MRGGRGAINREYGWMQPQKKVIGLYHFNQERVTRLPEAAIAFASSPDYTDFAYTLGDNILSMQGHPEQPQRAMNNFLKSMTSISDSERDLAHARINKEEPDSGVWGQWMMRFIEA